MFLKLLSSSFLVSITFADSNVHNSCSADDLTFFSSALAEWADLSTISQNGGANTDAFEAFVTSSMTADFNYFSVDVNGAVYGLYTSRNDFLTNWISDIAPFGDSWFYVLPGYGTCDKRSSSSSRSSSKSSSSSDDGSGTATYIARGGDNVRGANGINVPILARFVTTFVQDGDGSWKFSEINIEVVSDFGFFVQT